MSTYLVFQPELNAAQIALVNEYGWGAHPVLNAYASMSLAMPDTAQRIADDATHNGLYQFSYMVDTDNLDTLFDACNNHSKEGDVVRKLRANAHSMSVGDLVMDAWGQFHMCCCTGWKRIDAAIDLVGDGAAVSKKGV
jgi:hypothetical protein